MFEKQQKEREREREKKWIKWEKVSWVEVCWQGQSGMLDLEVLQLTADINRIACTP